jgi:ribonuclease III
MVESDIEMAVNARFQLQRRLGYTWNNQTLLGQALTHSSFTGGKSLDNNERLEFIGDSVLDLLCAEFLYVRHPDKREGFMSQERAQIVRKCALAARARELRLGELMLVAPSQQDIRRVDGVLADCMEAVVGSAYLDGGLEAARQVTLCAGIIGSISSCL